MSFPLDASGTAQFVSNGAGGTIARVFLGPQKYGESWDVKSASISTTSTAQSTCRMYHSFESPNSFIDGTSKANLNVSNIETVLGSLERLLFVFTDGDMGAYATVALNGTMELIGHTA